jgi:hypothetical protein
MCHNLPGLGLPLNEPIDQPRRPAENTLIIPSLFYIIQEKETFVKWRAGFFLKMRRQTGQRLIYSSALFGISRCPSPNPSEGYPLCHFEKKPSPLS